MKAQKLFRVEKFGHSKESYSGPISTSFDHEWPHERFLVNQVLMKSWFFRNVRTQRKRCDSQKDAIHKNAIFDHSTTKNIFVHKKWLKNWNHESTKKSKKPPTSLKRPKIQISLTPLNHIKIQKISEIQKKYINVIDLWAFKISKDLQRRQS